MTRKVKLIVIISAIFLILSTATGVTLAYILRGTPPVENSFDPVHVSCLVEEEFDGKTKSNVKIKNTSDINAYVRATYIVMWMNEDGSVLSQAPVLDVDYTVTKGSDKWVLGSDGFYYYTSSLLPNVSSDILIKEIKPTENAPKGYFLSVHVAATAIQAEPTNAVTEAWNAVVSSNGTLVAP